MSTNILITAGVVLAVAAIVLYVSSGDRQTTPQIAVPSESVVVSDHSKWLEYTAPNSDFKVMLPKIPRYAIDTVMDKKFQSEKQFEIFLTQEDNGSVFSINKITYAADADLKGDKIVEDLLTEMFTENPKNSIKNMTPIPYKGKNAVEYTVENDAVYIHGIAFLQDKSLYVLSTSSKEASSNDKDFDFFLNSFDIQSNKLDSTKK